MDIAGIDWTQVGVFAVLASNIVLIALAWYVMYREKTGRPVPEEMLLKIQSVTHLVREAEKALINAPGYEKFEWVLSKLREHFPDVDEEEAEILIESGVSQMKDVRPRPAQPGPTMSGSAGNGPIDDRGGEYWLSSGRQN